MRLGKTFFGLVLALVLQLPGPALAISRPWRATQARVPAPELVQEIRKFAPQRGSSADSVIDAGAFAIDAPSGDSVPPGPILPRGTVHNYGDSAVQIPARFDIYNGDSLAYSSSDSAWVEAGANGTITFDQWVATGGSYLARLTTMLVGDQNPANDTLSAQFFVLEPGHDVSVVILAPVGIVDTMPQTPRARVKNFGSYAETLWAYFQINDSETGSRQYLDSVFVAVLEPGGTADLDFPVWGGHHPEGLYYDKSRAVLSEGITTDTARASFRVMGRIVDVGISSIEIPVAVDSGTVVTPSMTVRNFGNSPADFNVTVSINISPQYLSTVSVTGLSPCTDTILSSFAPWPAIQRGVWTLRCSLQVVDQQFSDTVSGTVIVNVHDLSAKAIVAPVGGVPPITMTPKAKVHNCGTLRESCTVTFSINSSPPYTDTKDLTGLPVGTDTVLAFVDWPASNGSYTARCSTYLTNDQVPGNDVVTDTFQVNLGDVGVTEILSPGNVDTSTVVTPSALVRNFFTIPYTFPVRFTIADESDAIVYVGDTWVIRLAGNSSDTVTFPTWPKPHAPGWYAAKCSIMSGDADSSNNVRTSFFRVGADVGVTAIVVPFGSYDTISVIAPSARVVNLGSFPISFKAFFAFNSTPAYSESISISNLSAGTESLVTFPTWAKPHASRYYSTLCSVYVAGDGNHSNDARTGSFLVLAGWARPWNMVADLPSGDRHKNIKGGGALAYAPGPPYDGHVYAFKGNNTCEFYRYSVETNSWASRDSIPAIGRSGKTKGVKKGSSLTFAGDGKLYATKGNHTCEFWQYDPTRPDSMHWTEIANEVPTGGGNCKEGTSAVSATVAGTNYVYLLKGSATFEFYRYSADAGVWETMARAPRGPSGRPYRGGSSLTYDGGDTIYCLKGSFNEFFAYSINNDRWVTLETLPMKIPPPWGRKTKVKDGSGIAFMNRTVYALKGANTSEFWTYLCDSHRWYYWGEMPTKVNGGGALVAAPDHDGVFAFRGSNTLEFWECFVYEADGLRLSADGQPKDVQGQSTVRSSHSASRPTRSRLRRPSATVSRAPVTSG